MKIVRAPAALMPMVDTEFPQTLSDAVKIALVMPLSSGIQEFWLTLEEPIEAELDGVIHSAELVIQQWGFRQIAKQWVPLRVLDGESFDPANLELLKSAFKIAASAAKDLADTLYLENSFEVANIFYRFDWPHSTLFTAYVPPEIFEECKNEALNLGYHVEL